MKVFLKQQLRIISQLASCAIFTCLAFNLIAEEKVYRYTNEKGVTVFTDIPNKNNAQSISVKPTIQFTDADEQTPTSTSPTTQQATLTTPKKIITPKARITAAQYSITLNNPIDQQTIRSNSGQLLIDFSAYPTLVDGYTSKIYINDELKQTTENTNQILLTNIDRGEHTLKIELTLTDGKIIAYSKPVTFYMHRATQLTVK